MVIIVKMQYQNAENTDNEGQINNPYQLELKIVIISQKKVIRGECKAHVIGNFNSNCTKQKHTFRYQTPIHIL